jgi:ketosteroid isomerase-like protein
MRVAAITSALLAILSTVAHAQSTNVTGEVREFVKRYIQVSNEGDKSAYVEMYKDTPNLLMVTLDGVTRGSASLREDANAMMGTEGAYKISAGVVDVLPLGTTRAVAAFPFVAAIATSQGPVQIKGAMTLVLQKEGGKWVIIVDHTSTAVVETQSQ